MTALASFRTPAPRRRGLAACAGALSAGACLLIAGCSSGASVSSGGAVGNGPIGSGAGGSAPGGSAVHAPAVPGEGLPATAAGKAATGGGSATLTGLAPGQALIRTASLTVSTANVAAAVSRATSIVQAAGGYVSAEHSSQSRGRHTAPLVTIQFKVPPAAYQTTLTALAGLGTKQAETQAARDVTQTVADVTSRVASAQAAIVQLRKLLAHAGTVNGLLTVQEQINQQEAGLEALQSQQRALTDETTFATVSMVIQRPPPAAHKHHRHKKPGIAGFVGGLTAGWRALRTVVAALLTFAGAVLPFAVIAALLAVAGLATRRRITRRRAGATPAQ